MRIDGFLQIKAFYSWVFNNPDKVRPTHISLYLFLWNQGNRANWVEWFKCPYDLAMQGACIGNKGTYYRCLDDLQTFGLIHYKKGLNLHKAPQINLVKLYDCVPLTEQVTVPLSEPQGVPLTEQLPVHIYKLITSNKKLVIDNLENWIKNTSVGFLHPTEKLELKTKINNFIEWFNKMRIYYKLKGNVRFLEDEEVQNLLFLQESYTNDEFVKAFEMMMKEDWAKEAKQVLPKHFLKPYNFTKYINA